MVFYFGHVLPGAFFALFGIWHVANVYIRYYKCRAAGRQFFVSTTYPCFRSRLPLESLLKIVATTLGSISEVLNGYQPDQGNIIARSTIHIAMFTAFGLTGVADILVKRKVSWLHPKSDIVMSGVAMTLEGLLFATHRHPILHATNAHAVVQMTVHALLVDVIFSTALLIGFELFLSNNFLLSLVRSTLLIIQGTWLCQIEWVLSPYWNGRETRWDVFSDEHSMYCTMMFCFDVLACFLITALIGFVVRLNLRVKNHVVSHRRTSSPERSDYDE